MELLLLPLLHLDQVRVDQVSDQDKTNRITKKELSTPRVVIIDVLLVLSDLLSERFLHGLQCVQPLKRHLLESFCACLLVSLIYHKWLNRKVEKNLRHNLFD